MSPQELLRLLDEHLDNHDDHQHDHRGQSHRGQQHCAGQALAEQADRPPPGDGRGGQVEGDALGGYGDAGRVDSG